MSFPRRDQAGAQAQEPDRQRARPRRNIGKNLWEEMLDDQTSPERQDRRRQTNDWKEAAPQDQPPPSYRSAEAANNQRPAPVPAPAPAPAPAPGRISNTRGSFCSFAKHKDKIGKYYVKHIPLT